MNHQIKAELGNIVRRQSDLSQRFEGLVDKIESDWVEGHELGFQFQNRSDGTLAFKVFSNDLMIDFRPVFDADTKAWNGELSLYWLSKSQDLQDFRNLLFAWYFDNLGNVHDSIGAQHAHRNLEDGNFVEALALETLAALVRSRAVRPLQTPDA